MINNINWYPGHMKKTRELIQENLKAVDLVVEIVDSRIPLSSRNPIIDELISGKKRVVILGKCDLADKQATDEWKRYFEMAGDIALPVDSRNGDNIKAFYKVLDKYQIERNKARALKRPLRMMIVGVPNVGKSSFINRLIGKKSAKTGDRPGVTKGKQWVTLENGMQLLDTPGILWPKFEDPHVGLNLAFCGSIKDEILNVQDLAFELLKVLRANYPDELIARYKLDGLMGDNEEEYNEYGEPIDPVLADMEAIALKRGFIQSGKRIDYERTGRTILDEFRAGIIGNITLERLNQK
ncbi:ribosome biogenesis GTPase YlqF [Mogibacterium pumilum]|uniref:Ribosome biogenesis GTPase A n=1 Tax=Mogibacterium pumilum TaxID=86332 RepID=A0A223ATC8_9FIRM|nr:ribosome biogenesis GTPase YlqF [Mogibacterium pumilum]ASS38222.1 ribosome biogenesis GTPase YlqF [Mogibacterium pumilum]